MSRLTGTDILDLSEAYREIYSPQELTEEQVWEEVENWVNSLMEEGYDLSDYTWDDFYEYYLNEQPIYDMGGLKQQMLRNLQSRITIGPGGFRFNNKPILSKPSSYFVPNQPRDQNSFSRYGRPVPTQTRPTSSTQQRSTRPSSSEPKSVLSTAPATAAVRPSQGAIAPSSQSPVLGYQLAQKGSNIGSNILQQRPSLAQQTAELRAMRQRSQQRTAAQGGTPATPLVQSFDPFDIVMGHLINEGFAENEEAAVVIMSNMSEDWIQSILEV